MADPAPAKPMTLWEKVKTGVKGFVKSALHYVPTGILFAGGIMGVSYLLGQANPSLDFFGTSNMKSVGDVAYQFGKTLLIGGAISGGIGAVQSVIAENRTRNETIMAESGSIAKERSFGLGQQQEVDPIEVPGGLPTMAKQASKINPTLGFN